MKKPIYLFTVSILFILGIYALLIEPEWIHVTEYAAPIHTDHPRFRLALLSDLHLNKIGRTERNTLNALQQIKPQVIVLSGDIVDQIQSLGLLDEYLTLLPLSIKVATLGNWEHWSGINLTELQNIYNRHGVTLLINDCLSSPTSKLPVNIIGLDDYTAGHPDLRKAVQMCQSPSPLIVAEHSPQFFNKEDISTANGKAQLNLAGHTHGGQITLFGRPIWLPPGSGKYLSGWYETANGPLYVTRGIGTSIFPIRFGSRPEITVFEL